MYDNEKAILGVSKQAMQDVIDYKTTQADYAITSNYPELVLMSQLVKAMPAEVYKAFTLTPEGNKVNKIIAANFSAAAQGIDKLDTSFEDKSKAIQVAQTLQRTAAPALLKGSSIVSAAQSVNSLPSISNISDRDFDVVINNARGVAAIFDNPHTQATKRQLQTSNNPNENALGIQMEAEERRAKALSNAGAYLQSATEGGQALRYILENSTIGNNLRVNNKGQLVFVPGTSKLAAVAEGVMEQFENYGGMIDTINTDVAKTTGLSGDDLIDFYRSLGIPTLAEGERVQGAPAFNWTTTDEIRARIERLKEQKKNMSPVALKEYGEGLDKDIKAGEELLSKLNTGNKIVVSSSISHSEPMAFAKVAPAEDPYGEGMPSDMIEHNNKVQEDLAEQLKIAKVIAKAVRKAEPDSEEFNELMQVLTRQNKILAEYGEEPVDPYEDR